MNMKMRLCLPSKLTQAMFYLRCLSVLIKDPPHCGTPVWQPASYSVKQVRRGRIQKGWNQGEKEDLIRSSKIVKLHKYVDVCTCFPHVSILLICHDLPCSWCSHRTAGWRRSGSLLLAPIAPSPRTKSLQSSTSDPSTTRSWTRRNLLVLKTKCDRKKI